MRTENFSPVGIDGAAERILEELNITGSSSSRNNVIYFDGWDGLGASTVLREVSRRLNLGAGHGGPESLRVLHVDCSKWESRRALQRALAGQLGLPAPVMKLFDARDEDDYYQGITEGSRADIREVGEAISQYVQKEGGRFVVIFHNGSDEEVDLDNLGFPLSGAFSRHKVLWSFQGRFRLYPRAKVDAALAKTTSTTDLVLLAEPYHVHFQSHKMIMKREAEELVCDISLGGLVDSAATSAANCVLYMTKLCRMGNDLTDYDLTHHGFNYCICDGIIQLQQQGDVQVDDSDGGATDRLWRWSDALQRQMLLDTDYYQNPQYSPALVPVKRSLHDRMAFWASPTYGFMLIPASQRKHIPQDMFLPFNRLCVLKLYDCVFSFKSPPFLCCHSLRFLWIDYCQDQEAKDEEVAAEEDLQRCFQRLWVLHVQFTSAFLSAKIMGFITQVRELNVMGQEGPNLDLDLSQAQLPNVQKLRVAGQYLRSDLPLGMDKLELLDFSGNGSTKIRTFATCCRSLVKVITIQEANHYLKDISLKGCVNLKNLFLSGSLPFLHSLDISGTAVKTLDLSEVAVPKLGKLFLFDCWKLRAIRWTSPGNKWLINLPNLGIDTTVVGIDTTQRDHHDGGSSPLWPTEFGWYIAARDARLLQSLEPVKDQLDRNNVHLDISTTSASSHPASPNPQADGSKDGNIVIMSNKQLRSKNKNTTIYADVIAALTFEDDSSMWQQANEGDSKTPDVMCICPPPPYFLPSQSCYMHIEDSRSKSITVLDFIRDSSKILHIHDSLFSTHITSSSHRGITWRQLEWCRVERCPKLERVFSIANPWSGSFFNKLRTIWASHLPQARSIWQWSPIDGPLWILNKLPAFLMSLTFLHLDRCPRMIDVISVQECCPLETLEITFCNSLVTVFFPWKFSMDSTWRFPELKHIHLHEVPRLQCICGAGRYNVLAPKLEKVKIRGCWGLKRLPYVGGKNTVECDCEKEWWDALKWDSKFHADSYKPTHPRHYKKKMLRGSVLR